MSTITNSDENEIGYLNVDLVSGHTTDPFVLSVVAATDRVFASGTSPLVQVSVREHGTLDPYVPLEDGVDLSGYTPGTQVRFDVIVSARPVTGRGRGVVTLSTRDPGTPAGWTT